MDLFCNVTPEREFLCGKDELHLNEGVPADKKNVFPHDAKNCPPVYSITVSSG